MMKFGFAAIVGAVVMFSPPSKAQEAEPPKFYPPSGVWQVIAYPLKIYSYGCLVSTQVRTGEAQQSMAFLLGQDFTNLMVSTPSKIEYAAPEATLYLDDQTIGNFEILKVESNRNGGYVVKIDLPGDTLSANLAPAMFGRKTLKVRVGEQVFSQDITGWDLAAYEMKDCALSAKAGIP